MSAMTRTILFVVVAAVSVGLAVLADSLTRPAAVAGFEKVGEPFYPDFNDPLLARAIRVAAFDEKAAEPIIFNVEFKDGRWRIPSHHGYPAEGGERLAKTAASVIGITRGALASRRATDHQRFGVVDPIDPKSVAKSGHGQRVTLYDEADKPLADYILGKKIKGSTDEYYIRRADEDHTYIAKVKIDLSTKFSDWIEPDLLKVDSDKLIALSVRQPFADPVTGDLIFKTSELFREKSTQPWQLKGLDEETEELKTSDVTRMVNKLDDLKLLGVRPKPAGVNADLSFTIPPAYSRNPAMANSFRESLLRNLASRGFFIQEDGDGKQHVLSREGEVTVGTSEGVLYHLHFGNVFTGSLEEIEVGATEEAEAETLDGAAASQSKDANEAGDDQPETSGDDSDKDSEAESDGGDDSSDSDKQESRYLFVRVEFDPSLLGPAPVPPVEPVKPEGLDDEPADDKKAEGDEKADGDQKSEQPADAPSDNEKKDDKKAAEEEKAADDKAPAESEGDKPAEDEKAKRKAEYEKALADYEKAKQQYESDKTAYDSRMKEGRQKVDDLNQRFGDWYYVIPASSFNDLRLARSDLVQPKEKKEDESGGKSDDKPAGETPPFDSPAPAGKPADKPAETPAEKPAEKPADQKPADAAAEKKEEPAEAAKPAEKPAAEVPPADNKPAEKPKPAPDKSAEDKPAGQQPADAPNPAPKEPSEKADEPAAPPAEKPASADPAAQPE